MKRIIVSVLVFMCVLGLVGCNREIETSNQQSVLADKVLYNNAPFVESVPILETDKTEEDRVFSSYYSPEFMVFEEKWGITLTVENITSKVLTIICTQADGEPTGELQTGSWFILEQWTQENGWKEMPYVVEGEFAWTQEAWIIPMNDVCKWEVNWEWLYGNIPAGKYRIGKEIDDFRETGDFDEAIYFVEFDI